MHSPQHLQLTVIRRINHYLKGSSHRGLLFSIGINIKFRAYSDVDWAGSPES